MTVIPLSDGCVSVKEDLLREAIARYDKSDDVFRKDFLSGVMFTGSSKVQVTPEAIEMLHSAGTSWIEVVDANTPSTPPPGPYYVLGERMLDIWELHDDSQGAFLTSLIPGANE